MKAFFSADKENPFTIQYERSIVDIRFEEQNFWLSLRILRGMTSRKDDLGVRNEERDDSRVLLSMIGLESRMRATSQGRLSI